LLPVTYKNQTFHAKLVSPGYASNGNAALYLFKEGEPIDIPHGHVVSTNVDVALPDDLICIKNWNEYDGIEQPLIDAGIIEEYPVNYIPSGMVRVPVYALTDKAIATL